MPPHKSYTRCDGIWLSESKSREWQIKGKPIGIRFNPTDQALGRILVDEVSHRLVDKVLVDKVSHRDTSFLSFFVDIEVYKHEPWSLSSEFAHEGKSYCFTRRRKKSENGKGKSKKKSENVERINIDRTVSGCGFWQKTGSDSTIEIRDNSIEKLVRITKTSLKFHTPKGKGTPWLMKEYVLESDKSNENLVKSDDLDPLVLCVIYSNDDGKENQSYGSGTRSEIQSSMPDRVVGSSQLSDNIIPSSSSLPIPMQNYPNSYPPQNLSKPFADLVNPENCNFPFSTSTHEIVSKFSNHQVYASSNPGMITLQQGLPMLISSEQNMEMEFQGSPYWRSLNPIQRNPNSYYLKNFSMPFADHVNPENCHFPFSRSPLHEKFGNNFNDQLCHSSNCGMITLQPELPMFMNSEQNMEMESQVATYCSSLNTEPVSGSCFQHTQDSGQSSDSWMINLPNQLEHTTEDQPQPNPCENSYSIACSLSDKIKNNNLLDHNGSLNYNGSLNSNNQVNASSNPGMITLQKELPMCISSEQNMEMESQGSGQNMEMESQGARCWSSFNLRESNPNPYYLRMPFADHVNLNNYCQSPFSMSPRHEICGNISNDQLYHSSNPGMITLQPELSMLMSQVATHCGSLNTEPVSGSCFQQIQDSGRSSDSCMINLPVQQAHFMDDQLPPESCENSSSIVYSLSDKIKNNNLSDQNGSLNYSSMVPNGPLFSPFPNEIFMCDDNC